MTPYLTYDLAYKICSGTHFSLDQFINEGTNKEYLYFSHYNFFYSFPEFGKQWPDGKKCEFHRIETCCKFCQKTPSRNYAGVGTLVLYKKENIPRRFILFCTNSCKEWRDTKKFEPVKYNSLQMQLKLL